MKEKLKKETRFWKAEYAAHVIMLVLAVAIMIMFCTSFTGRCLFDSTWG